MTDWFFIGIFKKYVLRSTNLQLQINVDGQVSFSHCLASLCQLLFTNKTHTLKSSYY